MDETPRAADTSQAMSHDDAATVRRAYELWNESGPAAVIDRFYAEDAVYREAPGWPDAGVFSGREAALQRMLSLIELAGPIKVQIDDLIELDDGRFVACVRNVGQGEGSETPYTQSFAVVHRLRGGLIVEADYYLDRAAALEAVGLGE
jgi:ketosteroid isomerase-like protein